MSATAAPLTDVQQSYQVALDSFVSKIRQDPYILAAILFGSLSYDQVWEKSDIDIYLVGKDEKQKSIGFSCVENGINIHAVLLPRSKFKESMQRALQSSFLHSSFSRSTLLFTHDESIKEYYEDVFRIGDRDRELQLLRAASSALPTLYKAEKWFYVKRDFDYSFLWILYTVSSLAEIEVLLHGEVTGREVIHQALKHNPVFFKCIYSDLINRPKDAETIEQALRQINNYLDEKVQLLFKPILQYLAAAGGVRSTTDIDSYFAKQVQFSSLAFAYEFLADREIIRKVPVPLRLHEKSKIRVEEAAYYYDGEEFEDNPYEDDDAVFSAQRDGDSLI